MRSTRDSYIPPVGFAREPGDERRRWLSRIVLAVIVVFLAWLVLYRVVDPQDTIQPPPRVDTQLPAPV